MTKENIYILNRGHALTTRGFNPVAGKCDPTGKFREGDGNARVIQAIKKEMTRRKMKRIDLLEKCKTNVSLKDRIRWINDFCEHTDFYPILIEAHSNAAGPGWNQARGFATWCDVRGVQSNRLASCVHSAIAESGIWGKEHDRGIRHPVFFDRFGKRNRRAYISMIEKTKCPGVLVEPGFHDNKEDLKIIISKDYPATIAAAICDGVENYEALG